MFPMGRGGSLHSVSFKVTISVSSIINREVLNCELFIDVDLFIISGCHLVLLSSPSVYKTFTVKGLFIHKIRPKCQEAELMLLDSSD